MTDYIKNKRTADFTVRLVFYVLRAQAEYMQTGISPELFIKESVLSTERRLFICLYERIKLDDFAKRL